MKSLRVLLVVLATSALIPGCASTGGELSQKEKDRINREMERANRKDAQTRAQAESKMLRNPNDRKFGR